MKIGSAAEVRSMDQMAMERYGIAEPVLMENAAWAALQVIKERWGIKGRRVLLLCGGGNNGGDGFALARLLYSQGALPKVLMAGSRKSLHGSAETNYKILSNLPLELRSHVEEEDFSSADVLVDALFGTGLSRPIEGIYGEWVDKANQSQRPILALDIPSGVHADTGEVLGKAIHAEATVVFGILKRGNLFYPGYAWGGNIYLSPISFPPELTSNPAISLEVNIPPALPKRRGDGHKGSFGRVLVIAGAKQYYGAPALCSAATLKAGAGFCYLACPAPLVPSLAVITPETVFLPQEMGPDGALTLESLADLTQKAKNADCVAAGPGLSSSSETASLLRQLLPRLPGGLVLDGDGLGALAGKPELIRDRQEPAILTPHMGELSQLSGLPLGELNLRRLEIARETADRYGAVVVLKGAHSLVAEPGGRLWVNLTGNDGMGTAGSGDVLTGIIAALRAAGKAPIEAARLGVFLHGRAGDIAAASQGREGMRAMDILTALPLASRDFQEASPFAEKITLI